VATSTDNSVTFDNVVPTVTINQAVGQADPTRVSPINFAVVFSEFVTGFDASDVTLSTTGTLTGTPQVTVTGSGLTYNVAVAGLGVTGTGVVTATVASGVAIDSSGNGNSVSTSTDNSILIDTVSPTVTINQSVAQSDPTTSSPINFTVNFSEPVTGFAANDVTLSGAAPGSLIANVTGSGSTYNVSVTGMTGLIFVTASIPAGAAVDAAGNSNAASTSTDDTVTFGNLPASSRFFRLDNPNNKLHFFTTSLGEFNDLKAKGYEDESTTKTGFGVSPTSGTGKAAIHRLYQPMEQGRPSGLHYYTTNDAERDTLSSPATPAGERWISEGDVGFIFTSATPGTAEVFHLVNNLNNEHLFLIDANEKNGILADYGPTGTIAKGIWRQDASLGFGVPQGVGTFTTGGGTQIPARGAAAVGEATLLRNFIHGGGINVSRFGGSSAGRDVTSGLDGRMASPTTADITVSSSALRSSINDVSNRLDLTSGSDGTDSGDLRNLQTDDFWSLMGAGIESNSFWQSLNDTPVCDNDPK
jgi:hypothetical protein